MASSASEIRAEIDRLIRAEADDEIARELDRVAAAVQAHWIGEAPVEHGEYKKSIKVRKLPDGRNGLPRRRVIATDRKAHWIEFGTGDPGPTPEFAPGQKTATHFGGTLDATAG